MAIGKDSLEKDKVPAPIPAPAPDEDASQNPPAEPDLPPDSEDKPSPPGYVDNRGDR